MLARIFARDEFTGWHMVGVIGLFFGTIISVNLTLAYFAIQSWTGLVVENSYVASQNFNENMEKKQAQAKLGWQASTTYQDDQFSLMLTDKSGQPVQRVEIVALIGRPATEVDDRSIVLLPNSANEYSAHTELGTGLWNAKIIVVGANGAQWDQNIRFRVASR